MRPNSSSSDPHSPVPSPQSLPPPEWQPAGHETLKRSLLWKTPFRFPERFPPELGILVPDLAGPGEGWGPEDLLFFDLETTGLGGAGTVAFLAAFGRFERGRKRGEFRLRVVQYLLLDYPGEGDFLEALIAELGAGGPVLVTYNGKSFDAQILKNRCLMNGIRPPAFFHADLLHPCRRLWKRVLPDCSQGTIETAILGLDRSGDVPGALAPDIWFAFLKTGDFAPLGGIADHNVRDIAGLARIFAALGEIAAAPLPALGLYRCDLENLALRWRRAAGGLEAPDRTGEALLEAASERGCPRAAYIRALDRFRSGRVEEGRSCLEALAGARGTPAFPPPPGFRAQVCRKLAIDAERRLGDRDRALFWAEEALGEAGLGASLRRDLERQRARLVGRISH